MGYTNNYAFFCKRYRGSNSKSSSGDAGLFVDINGTSRTISYTDSDSYIYCELNPILLGTGVGVPSLSDYCLFNDITSSLDIKTLNSTEFKVIDNIPRCIDHVSAVVVNTSGDDITLTEYGIKSRYSTTALYYLIYHEMFETPITIPNGDTYTLALDLIF